MQMYTNLDTKYERSVFMKFKDKIIFSTIASFLLCLWFFALFLLVSPADSIRTVFAACAIISFVGGLACLRAIGEYDLWMDEKTRPVAEAKNRYGYRFRGWWF